MGITVSSLVFTPLPRAHAPQCRARVASCRPKGCTSNEKQSSWSREGYLLVRRKYRAQVHDLQKGFAIELSSVAESAKEIHAFDGYFPAPDGETDNLASYGLRVPVKVKRKDTLTLKPE